MRVARANRARAATRAGTHHAHVRPQLRTVHERASPWHPADVTTTDFPEPWSRLEGEAARAFEQEAATEIAAGHELHGLALAAIAKCEGCDSVVFRASDDTFAMAHLSWTRKPEAPPWPATTRLGGFIAVEVAMDHHDH